MNISHRGLSFAIDPEERFSVAFFTRAFADWEAATFAVLERLLFPGALFLDIGAWIGPLTLFAAASGARVLALEPDPVAFTRLQRHLAHNDFGERVTVRCQGLADRAGPRLFGGNGELGNSMSTLLAGDPDYLSSGGSEKFSQDSLSWRIGDRVKARMITLEKLLDQEAIAPEHISLLKLDIEGSEKIVIPAIAPFLARHRPRLLLSLHWVFLQRPEIASLLALLVGAYGGLHLPDGTAVEPGRVLDEKMSELLLGSD